MSFETIPAGYQVHFDSYEGDADSVHVKVVSGLTKATAEFYVKVGRLFYSQYHGEPKGFGGTEQDVTSEAVKAALIKLLEEAPDLSEAGRQLWDGSTDKEWCVHDALESILGTGGDGYYEYFRTVQDIAVYYILIPVENCVFEF